MAKADLEEMYEMVAVGDTVELVGARDEETAQIFGDGDKPMVTAKAETTPAVETTTAAARTEAVTVAGVAVAGTW